MNMPSKRHRSVARRMVALVALAIAVLLAFPALAGTLHTTDDAGVLTPAQLAGVRSKTQGCDFDVRLITTSSYASKSDLGNYVHRFVTEPNIVVIGLDPVHRHVSVHFGTGTRIADSEFNAVESAGLASFKSSDWAGGVVAILDRAERAVGTGGGHPAGAVGAAPSSASSGTGGFGILFWFVAIACVLGLVFWIATRRRSSYGPPPAGGGYGPPIGGGGYGPGPSYGGPSYGGGGGSGLGGNIASAGIGGLVGYEIGKEVAESHHHHRYDEDDRDRRPYEGADDRPREQNAGGDSAEPGNYDAGGASGGWDDSGGGGGSSDGGGDSGGGGGGADF
jgi:hypothetical protein